jgi:hypothetical protein
MSRQYIRYAGNTELRSFDESGFSDIRKGSVQKVLHTTSRSIKEQLLGTVKEEEP